MPGYGIEEGRKNLLSWKWAEEVLSTTQNYYLATTRQDGRPHVMPIWGLWMSGQFYFSTGRDSVKARNMSSNPNCVLCAGDAGECAILEGIVEVIEDRATLKKFAKLYLKKYKYDVSDMNQPVFRIRPQVVFGQIEKTYTQTATRWRFD